MTQKKSYSRYFIILQEDEKGYALASDKLPSGYAKLEIKNDRCKVSYYVQNLKKESAPYYMVLICNKKDAKKLLKLGELNIDDHGRAEIFYEYPVDSVGNSGVNVDKIVGASIVRMMNSNVIPVMSGFTSTDIPDWKGFPMIEEDRNRQEEERLDKKGQSVKAEAVKQQPAQAAPVQVQPTQEVPVQPEETLLAHPEETKEKPIVEEELPAEEVQQQPANIFDEYEMKIEQAKEQKPVGTENNMYPMDMNPAEDTDSEEVRNKKKCKDNVCEIHHENECKENNKHSECKENEHHENKKHEECKENDHHENKKHEECKKHSPKGSVGSFFMDVADGFEELEDICTEIKRCRWFKVPVYRPEDMTNCMDYNKYTVVFYPMMNYYQYIRNFGHFIMGYKLDKENKMKYLVYGIPGTKSRRHQPFGGRSGFVTWVPLKEGEEDEDSYGYWLMFYDFRSSTIVIPVK